MAQKKELLISGGEIPPVMLTRKDPVLMLQKILGYGYTITGAVDSVAISDPLAGADGLRLKCETLLELIDEVFEYLELDDSDIPDIWKERIYVTRKRTVD